MLARLADTSAISLLPTAIATVATVPSTLFSRSRRCSHWTFAGLDDVAMMRQAIEHGSGHPGVAEYLRPNRQKPDWW
jgi:hypothetical protein